jgi:phosphinothricin acetyltransferase
MSGIRLVEIEDAPRLAAIYEPMVRDSVVSFELDPPSPEEMAARIETVTATHPWLVLAERGDVVGYAYATSHRQRPAYRWSIETTIYMHPGHQHRGLGKRLYSALLELATLWGYANAYAGITLPNPGSQALHAAVGFAQIGVFPRAGFKMGEWHDVGWWHRALTEPSRQPPEPGPPPPERTARLLTDFS